MANQTFSMAEAKGIGDSLNIDWNKFSLEDFCKGMNIELEHGSEYADLNVTNDDALISGKIALAHMREFPDYYQRLEKMEEEAKKAWKISASD